MSCNPFKCSKCATFVFPASSILKSHYQKNVLMLKKRKKSIQQVCDKPRFSEDNLWESVFLDADA